MKNSYFLRCLFSYFILFLINSCHSYDADIGESLNESPHILSGNMNITAYVGDTVKLPCEVAHLGNHHVNWLKIQENNIPLTLTVGYQQFSRNMRYRVARVHEKNTRVHSWSFEIRKVAYEDQGLYQCYVKLNSKEKIKANINLIVKSERERLNKKKLDSYPNYLSENPRSERLSGSSVEKIDMVPNNWVKLRCNTSNSNTGSPAYDMQWFKDGQLIQEQDSRRLKKWLSSSENSNYMDLELYAVDPDDSGVYQCKRDTTILRNVVLNVLNSNGASNQYLTTNLRLCVFIIISFLIIRRL